MRHIHLLPVCAGLVLFVFSGMAHANISTHIYDPAPSFCSAYATKAVSQYHTARAAQCNVAGLRWNDDFEGQKKWCDSMRQEVAQSENRARAETLLGCFHSTAQLRDSDLDMIPDVLGSAMIRAVRQGNLQRVQQLLAAGTDLSYQGSQGNDGTILFVAISTGSESIARFFIGLGMNPNTTFNGGYSPIASSVGNTSLLEYLLEHGGDANNTGELYDFRELPMVSAINHGNLEAAKLLIHHGARVQVDESMDECSTSTLLDYAIKEKQPGIALELRKAGARAYAECASP
jgi:hypothetical protein